MRERFGRLGASNETDLQELQASEYGIAGHSHARLSGPVVGMPARSSPPPTPWPGHGTLELAADTIRPLFKPTPRRTTAHTRYGHPACYAYSTNTTSPHVLHDRHLLPAGAGLHLLHRAYRC
jgi:hypothetical protein